MNRSIIRNFLYGVVTLCLVIVLGCSSGNPSPNAGSTSATNSTANAPEQTQRRVQFDTIRIRPGEGNQLITLKVSRQEAQLRDQNNELLAVLVAENARRLKIETPEGQLQGYAVANENGLKLENADRSANLFSMRQQDNGNYRVIGSDGVLYQIRDRENGMVIYSSTDESVVYKVIERGDRLVMKDGSNAVIFRTNAELPTLAFACFGLEELSLEQQAACAYSMIRTENRANNQSES